MKTYVKSNNILYSGNTSVIKVYSTLPSDLSDISEDEIIILENVGFYQKINNNLEPLFNSSSTVSDGAVGDIIAYYGNTNPDPDNYVVCNGSTFSSTDFPALYSLLGTNTTPNLNGYHLKGVGNNATWSSHDAISLKSKVSANYPNHTHTVNNPGHTHSVNQGSHYHSACYSSKNWICLYRGGSGSYSILCDTSWDDGIFMNQTTSASMSSLSICSANLGTVTIGCPTTASGYNTVRYGSETKCKDKTVLFLMRAK